MSDINNNEMESVEDERARMRSEEMRLRRLKRKREHRQKIRRLIMIAICLVIVLAVALGIFIAGKLEPRSAENLLTVKSDFSLIYEEVEDRTNKDFDKAEMKSYIHDQISSFNESNGKGSIKLQRFAWGDEKIYVRTKYKDIETYSKFTGYQIFTGDLTGALAAGYDVNTGVKKVSGGEIGKEDATSADIDGKKIFVIKENTAVKLPGKIIAVSSTGVELLAEDTVRISSVSEEDDAALSTVIIYE